MVEIPHSNTRPFELFYLLRTVPTSTCDSHPTFPFHVHAFPPAVSEDHLRQVSSLSPSSNELINSVRTQWNLQSDHLLLHPLRIDLSSIRSVVSLVDKRTDSNPNRPCTSQIQALIAHHPSLVRTHSLQKIAQWTGNARHHLPLYR